MTTTMKNTRRLTMTAILAATSAVLMFFSFPVPLMPSFIKLDFSELPALIAAFTMGPLSGVAVCFVKNLVNLTTTTTGGVGELSNFLLGSVYVLPAGIFFQKYKSKKSAIILGSSGALLMAFASVATNFFVVYPIYFLIMAPEAVLGLYHVINPIVGTEYTDQNLLTALLTFNMPFTFIKGMLSVVVTTFLYKPLEPIIRGKLN